MSTPLFSPRMPFFFFSSFSLPSQPPFFFFFSFFLLTLNQPTSGSSTHTLTLYNTSSPHPLSVLEPTSPSSYSGVLPHLNRNTPIASAALHPHRMVLAGGAMGSTWVNLWGCKGAERGV